MCILVAVKSTAQAVLFFTEIPEASAAPLIFYFLIENIWPNNLKFFLGCTPFLAPQSAASPKMTTPALPMTPLFYCRILFHTKNVDVCKKRELNPLRFDRDIRVLSQKKNIFKYFHFFDLQTKKRHKSVGF